MLSLRKFLSVLSVFTVTAAGFATESAHAGGNTITDIVLASGGDFSAIFSRKRSRRRRVRRERRRRGVARGEGPG